MMVHINLIASPVVVVTVQCLCIIFMLPEIYSSREPLEQISELEESAIFINITTARKTKLVEPLIKRSDTKRELPPNGKLFGEEFYPCKLITFKKCQHSVFLNLLKI